MFNVVSVGIEHYAHVEDSVGLDGIYAVHHGGSITISLPGRADVVGQ
jgi:hypothetical protein